MKVGEFVLVWAMLTIIACLSAGMEAVNRSWPQPTPEQSQLVVDHIQQAAMAVGFPAAGMMLAIILAWVICYVLGAVVLAMLLVEAIRWVRSDAAKRRRELADAQARLPEGTE